MVSPQMPQPLNAQNDLANGPGPVGSESVGGFIKEKVMGRLGLYSYLMIFKRGLKKEYLQRGLFPGSRRRTGGLLRKEVAGDYP